MNKLLEIGEIFTANPITARIIPAVIVNPIALKKASINYNTKSAVITIVAVTIIILISKKLYESTYPSNKQ